MFSHRKHLILTGVVFAAVMMLAAPVMAADNAGFIYGKVTTVNGNSYQGLIRWGDEEAFWDDLFNSAKVDVTDSEHWSNYEDALEEYQEEAREAALEALEEALEEIEEEADEMETEADELEDEVSELEEELEELEDDRDSRRVIEREIRELQRQAEHMRKQAQRMRKESERKRDDLDDEVDRIVIQTGSGQPRTIVIPSTPRMPRIITRNFFDGKMNIRVGSWGGTRQFMVRFGDIKTIEVTGDEDALVTMRNGDEIEVSGYANDVGGKLFINDTAFGEITLPWDNIDVIEFMEAPSSAKPDAFRMKGVMTTEAGEYRGYIQWDSQECLSTDVLDGESEDGDLAISFGAIRSIERNNRRSAKVELRDGRTIVLSGTNDVNESIRGIFVEDERYGRVKAPWDIFDKVVFDDAGSSGRDYDWYGKQTKLFGKVTTNEGDVYEGRLIYDMDESASYEILNGQRFDVEYFIPFALVKSVTPRSRNSSTVVLTGGEEVRLYDQQDVGDSNDGVMIYPKGSNNEEDAQYVPWESIESVEFTH